MYIRTALTASLVAIILMVIPLSADYSQAEYQGKIVIENSGDAESRVTVRLDLNTDAFLDSGMLSSALDNIWFTNSGGNSMAFMPSPADNDQWYFFYPWTLPATSSVLSYLYMGGPDMTPPIRYLPGDAGMTTPDAASMELGDEFAIEIKGYVATATVAEPIVEKDNAFVLQTTGTGISASILSPPSLATSPTDHIDDTWSNEANSYDGNTGTNASLSHGANSWSSSFLELSQDPARVTAIKVHASISASVSNAQMDLDVWYDGDASWTDLYHATTWNRSAWTTFDLPAPADVTGVRIQFYNGTTYTRTYYVDEVEFVNEPAEPTVIATLSPGSYTLQVTADATDLQLYVNGTLADSIALDGAQVPDNANDWTVAPRAAMPYMEHYKHTVGGALKQHIVWENDATFTDLSGNGNDATPSFPNASSDPDVSASLASFDPAASASPPPGGSVGGGMAGDPLTEPEGLYREMEMDHLPGAALVNTLLDAGGIPRTLFWFPLVFVGIVILGLITYRFTKSLMAMGLTASVALVFASRAGIVPYWVTVPLILIAVAILVKEKMSPL